MESNTTRPLSGGAQESIESVAGLEHAAQQGISTHQRWIERATAAIGRPRAVYFTLAFVIAWIAINVGLARTGHAFDPPPFAYLEGIVSLSALLMTIFILTRENRTNQHDTRRDRLDLQINLLNERKISKVIEMLAALRYDSPVVPNRHDPEAHEMGRSTDPAAIARVIEEQTPSPT